MHETEEAKEPTTEQGFELKKKTELVTSLTFELLEIQNRIEKLDNALTNHADKIPSEHVELMRNQLNGMKTYESALKERLKISL